MSGERSSPSAARSPWPVRRLTIAAVIVLAIPAVAFVVGTGVSAKYHSDLVAYVEAEIGRPLTAEEQARLDLDVLCATPDMSGEDVCGDIRLASLTRQLAIAGAAVGAGLLLVVVLLGSRARRDRDALIRLFRPGLYITLAGLVAAVAIDGALAVLSAYLGLGVFMGRVFPVILIALALGGVLGVAAIIRAALGATKRGVSSTIGKRVDPEREPRLTALIHDLARETGTAAPDNVIVGLDPNFFVTELDVQTPYGLHRGRSLFLSLPLSRLLTEDELRAVLGHEMGHFRGADTAYSQRFYPIYAGAVGAIENLGAAAGGNSLRLLVLYPAALILGLFLDGFGTMERSISRDRELAADAVGATAATASDLGAALVKIAAFVPAFAAAMESVAVAARIGQRIQPTLGEAFTEQVRSAAAGDPFGRLDEQAIPHPTDSHPPLSERLDALGLTVDDLRAAASRIEPSPGAGALVADGAAIEAALSTWLRERMESAPARAVEGA